MSLISRRNLRCFVCWFCPIRELKSSHIRSRICLTNWPSRGSQIYNWNVRGNILINMLKPPPMWDQRWHLCGLITPQLGQRLIALKYSLVTRLVGIRGAFLSGSGARVSPGTLLLWKVKPMGEFSNMISAPTQENAYFLSINQGYWTRPQWFLCLSQNLTDWIKLNISGIER